MHGADGFTDGSVGVRTVAEHEVHVVEFEAVERGIDRAQQVFAVEGVPGVRAVVDPEVELGRHQVLVPRPLEFGQCLAHQGLGLATCIGLRIVEEVDARLPGGLHALERRLPTELGRERHPGSERQGAHLHTCTAQPAVLHLGHG